MLMQKPQHTFRRVVESNPDGSGGKTLYYTKERKWKNANEEVNGLHTGCAVWFK